MNAEPIVYVVDDDQHMRGSLCRLLKSAGLSSQGFGSADDFLNTITTAIHGCAVVDVRMPGMCGLDLQTEMTRRGITIPTVFISGFAEIPNVVRAVKAGAIDFLEKPFNDQVFLDRVQQAIEISRVRQAKRSESAEKEEFLSRFTPREREVFELLVSGFTTKQIASRLGISPKTVDIHRGRVLQKSHVDSVVQLVNLAHRGFKAS